jgi:hypothetical protein
MLCRREFLLAGGCGLLAAAQEDALPEAPFRNGRDWRPLLNGKDLTGWKPELGWHGEPGRLNEWYATASVSMPADHPEVLHGGSSGGPIIVNGRETHTTNLISQTIFGDHELYVEFMIAKGSNSGVYLHGLYEVQVFDSYGKTGPLKFGDAGGIYEYGIDGQKGSGGTPPRTNACRPPGEWQSYLIRFRAPRFDAAGKKTQPARFERVVYNRTTIHEDVHCDGPTRSSLTLPETARNPLMLQGDHGPVAYRNLWFRML